MVFAIILIGLIIIVGIVLYIPIAKINAKYNKIQPNMTYDEVADILGRGVQIGNQSGMRTLSWTFPMVIKNIRVGKNRIVRVTFKDGKVLESELTVKEDIDMGDQPDGLGNDFLINICEWTRTNSTA